MITRIEIAGYKSIKNLDLELQSINILLGANGAGKSNFVSVFSLLKNVHGQNFQNYIQQKGGADSFLHFGKKNTKQIDLTFNFTSPSNDQNKFVLKLQVGQDNLFIKSTSTAFLHDGSWKEQDFESNVSESRFRYINRGQAFWVNDRLNEFKVYHFHDTSDSSPMKGMADLHDNRQLRSDGSNLAAFLYYLKETHPKYFRRIELTVKSIAPFFDHFVLEPNRLNERKIELEWREKGFPDTYFNAYHLSDGTLRFIGLATLLMQPEPPQTIIIDEPELGLHPVAINKLAGLIRKASDKTQIIISTQSINLVDNFEPEDVIVTNRTAQGSTFKRLRTQDLQAWLEDYTLGDLWGKNKIGAQPYNV